MSSLRRGVPLQRSTCSAATLQERATDSGGPKTGRATVRVATGGKSATHSYWIFNFDAVRKRQNTARRVRRLSPAGAYYAPSLRSIVPASADRAAGAEERHQQPRCRTYTFLRRRASASDRCGHWTPSPRGEIAVRRFVNGFC
jgi:hypothetical protein